MEFFHYKSKLVRVIDGDTIVCDIDLGFDMWIKNEHVRLLGLDAPETRTKDLVEKANGMESKLWLESILYGKNIVLETVYDSGGKYGRTLATIWVEEEPDLYINVNLKMIDEGFAVEYPS